MPDSLSPFIVQMQTLLARITAAPKDSAERRAAQDAMADLIRQSVRAPRCDGVDYKAAQAGRDE